MTMTHYEAPVIKARDNLRVLLDGISRSDFSDAEIKHGIEPVTSYEAPAIVEQAPLNGSLVAVYRSREV